MNAYSSGVSFLTCLTCEVGYVCLPCSVVWGFPLFWLAQPPIFGILFLIYNPNLFLKIFDVPVASFD